MKYSKEMHIYIFFNSAHSACIRDNAYYIFVSKDQLENVVTTVMQRKKRKKSV